MVKDQIGDRSCSLTLDLPTATTDHYIRLVTFNTDGLDGGPQVRVCAFVGSIGGTRELWIDKDFSSSRPTPLLLPLNLSTNPHVHTLPQPNTHVNFLLPFNPSINTHTPQHKPKQLLARAEAAASILLDPWVPFDGLGRCVDCVFGVVCVCVGWFVGWVVDWGGR